MRETVYGIIGGVILAVILGTWRWLSKVAHRKREARKKHNQAVCRALVALLKDRLYQAYLFHCGKGHADIDAREIVMEMYQEYKSLGGNGVMDDLYQKFLALPTE